jgi:hypothetical protein
LDEAGREVFAKVGDPLGWNGFLLRTDARFEIEELEEEAADVKDVRRRGVEEAQVEHFTMGVGGRGRRPEAWAPSSTTNFATSLKLLSEVTEHPRSNTALRL